MGRTLVLTTLLLSAVYVYQKSSTVDLPLITNDHTVVRDTGELEVKFELGPAFSDAYMILGGNFDRKLRSSFHDVSLAALDMKDASRIHDDYPDVHMCKSAGAPLARNLSHTPYLNARNREVTDTLVEALALHRSQLAGNGKRTCVSLGATESCSAA